MIFRVLSTLLLVFSSLAMGSPTNWTVSNKFGDADQASFSSGDISIVVLRAHPKNIKSMEKRSDYSWDVLTVDETKSIGELFMVGSDPLTINFGASYWWWDERLVFDYRTHEVHLIARRGIHNNIAFEGNDLTEFWCRSGLTMGAPVTLDHNNMAPYNGELVDVCPTSLLKSKDEKKGFLPRKELYQIDTAGITQMISDMKLDEAANNNRQKITHIRQEQLAYEAKVRANALAAQKEISRQKALDIKRAEIAYIHGQDIIAKAEIGERLCTDISIRHSQQAVISAFLEKINGPRIQMRINSIISDDGFKTYDGPIRVDDGIIYATGSVIWTPANKWRACY